MGPSVSSKNSPSSTISFLSGANLSPSLFLTDSISGCASSNKSENKDEADNANATDTNKAQNSDQDNYIQPHSKDPLLSLSNLIPVASIATAPKEVKESKTATGEQCKET